MKKSFRLLILTLLAMLTACSSTKKIFPTADEPLSKDNFEWEQTAIPEQCKFRARDAEIVGITKMQTWIRVEFDNDGKTPLHIDPTKVILRSPLLKDDSIQPISTEKLIASVKGKVEGTDTMINESTWEGVKEIDDALGKDGDSAEVHAATASRDKRVRERESASDEKKRLERLVPMIETQSLKATVVEPGGSVSGILVYDTDFGRKGGANLDYTADPCKSSLSFNVKP